MWQFFSWRSLQAVLTWLLVLVTLFFLFIWRLGTLTPGLSSAETAARFDSSSIRNITDNPVNVPHKLLQYLFQSLGHSGAFWMRSVSVFFVLFFLSCFYWLVRNWFGRLVAVLGTLFLAGTPWVILLARNASPDIMLLWPLLIVASYSWLSKTTAFKYWAWLLLAFVVAVGLYVPGVIWFEIIALIFGGRRLMVNLKSLSKLFVTSTLMLFAILAAPLAIAAVGDLNVAKTILLIPSDWPRITDIIKAMGWTFWGLVWRTRLHTLISIGRLPILNISQIVLALFGIQAMWRRVRRETYAFIALILVGALAVAINNNLLLITIALPAIAVFVAGGLRYLYAEWRTVFPYNPIPRALALSLLGTLTVLYLAYGARYVLIAWPHTTDTRHTYVLK